MKDVPKAVIGVAIVLSATALTIIFSNPNFLWLLLILLFVL